MNKLLAVGSFCALVMSVAMGCSSQAPVPNSKHNGENCQSTSECASTSDDTMLACVLGTCHFRCNSVGAGCGGDVCVMYHDEKTRQSYDVCPHPGESISGSLYNDPNNPNNSNNNSNNSLRPPRTELEKTKCDTQKLDTFDCPAACGASSCIVAIYPECILRSATDACPDKCTSGCTVLDPTYLDTYMYEDGGVYNPTKACVTAVEVNNNYDNSQAAYHCKHGNLYSCFGLQLEYNAEVSKACQLGVCNCELQYSK